MNLLVRISGRVQVVLTELAQLVVYWLGGGNGDPDRLRAADARRVRNTSARQSRSTDGSLMATRTKSVQASGVRLRALERRQRWVQLSAGGMSIVFLFTMPFAIPAIVNGIVIVALLWVSLVLDRRIRALGGKGEIIDGK